MAIHSKTGASSMERWEPCPGSVRESNLVMPRETSSYADEGTRAHEYAAEWLTSKKQPAFGSKEMFENVRIYVELCNKYYQSSHIELGAARGIEYFFDCSDTVPGMYSTVDFYVWWPWKKHLVIIDFKYGEGVFVPVKDNVQLLYYADGVRIARKCDAETIELIVCQPRCMADTDVEPIRRIEITKAELDVFHTRLVKAIKATQDPNAPLVPGPHCNKWCPAAAVCPALSNHTEYFMTNAVSVTNPNYDPAKLAEWLDMRDEIKAKLKALDEFAYREILRGVKVPGYKVVSKRGHRKYKDIEKFKTLVEKLGLGDDAYEPRLLKTPAQFEKSFPEHKLLVELNTEADSNGYSLVKDDDDRTAIDNSPQAHFGILDITPTPALTRSALGLD